MNKLQLWLSIIGAVLIALTANSVSAIWASKEHKLTLWLGAVVVIAPFVFVTFGLVASKLGLARGSATVDSLLTITTILAGLILFRESNTLSLYQYCGIVLALVGIVLMQLK
jgi:uncharacterized membrane protein